MTTDEPIHRIRYEDEIDSTREPGTVLMEGPAPIAAFIARSLEEHAPHAPSPPVAPAFVAPLAQPKPTIPSFSDLTPAAALVRPEEKRSFLAILGYVMAFGFVFLTTVAVTFYFVG